jgi:uncharacterized membrane protein
MQDPHNSEPQPTLSRNIETIAAVDAKAERAVGHHQRLIETLTFRLGGPAGLYGSASLVLLWALFNLGVQRAGLRAPDPPPFVWMQGAIGFAALLVATMVLATQNRQGKQSERRAELDLHINLLAEQKIAKLVALLEELRRDLPSVRDRADAVADAMTQSVDPHVVLAALELTFEQDLEPPETEPRDLLCSPPLADRGTAASRRAPFPVPLQPPLEAEDITYLRFGGRRLCCLAKLCRKSEPPSRPPSRRSRGAVTSGP